MKHKIKEIEAPEGYNKSEEVIEVSVVENGETVTPVAAAEGIVNTKIRANLEILKVAKYSSKPLKGAKFALYHEDGTEIGIKVI